jgi:RecA/RadA recombinase
VLQAVRISAPKRQAAAQLFGRQDEERQALEAVRSERYVEIRGGPGEGKTTLALKVVDVLAAEWTDAGAGGELHFMDVQGQSRLINLYLTQLTRPQYMQWPGICAQQMLHQLCCALSVPRR